MAADGGLCEPEVGDEVNDAVLAQGEVTNYREPGGVGEAAEQTHRTRHVGGLSCHRHIPMIGVARPQRTPTWDRSDNAAQARGGGDA